MTRKVDYVVNNKNEKKAESIARVAKMIEELKGDRSIRRMADESGVAASYITGILKEKYLPSADILRKLSDASANPQNGVTLEDLMIAAGYQDDYVENLMIAAGYQDNDVEDTMTGEVHVELSEVEEDSMGARASRYRDVIVRRRQESMRFEQIASGAVLKALYDSGIKFGPGESGRSCVRGFKPDFSVIVGDKAPILDWWFEFKYVDAETAIRNKTLPRHLIERFMFLDAEPSRKISVVVDNRDTFEALAQMKNHLSYRGDLSVILIDPESYAVVREVYIAHFFENGEDNEFTIV